MFNNNFQVLFILQWIISFRLIISQSDDCHNELPKECGIPKIRPSLLSHLRIISGSSAIANSWPWQLSLQQNYNTWKHTCGASILSNCYAVTAAHCVEGCEPGQLRLVAGLHDRAESGHKLAAHNVSRIVIHPEYAGSATKYVNDIALLKVASAFKFSKKNSPVCLPVDRPVAGERAAATGWGFTKYGGAMSSELRQVELPIISPDNCRQFYPSLNLEKRFCAGNPAKGKDTCQGDSGGPLVTRPGHAAFHLTGITSAGSGCGQANKPGIYTDVFQFLDWITSFINESIACERTNVNECENECKTHGISSTCSCSAGFWLQSNLKTCVPECGKIGENDEHEWLISLRNVRQFEDHQCNGILVQSRWIITTPACIQRISSDFKNTSIEIFTDSKKFEDIIISNIICDPSGGACLIEINTNLPLMPICLQATFIKKRMKCSVGGWRQDWTKVSIHKCPRRSEMICAKFDDEGNEKASDGYHVDALICADGNGRQFLSGLFNGADDDDYPDLLSYFDVRRNLQWIRNVLKRR